MSLVAQGSGSHPASRWTNDVTRLANQIRSWLSPGVTVQPPDPTRPLNPALEIERNGIRLYLELASASEEADQAVVELWTSRGARVRLLGPDASGAWQVYTAEYVPMRYRWEQKDVAALVDALFSA